MSRQESLGAAWRAGDLLVVVDIADFKVRNWHLGFAEGDRDLAELEAIVADVAGRGRAVRLSGNVFGACVRTADQTGEISRRFAREQPIEVSYTCRATRAHGQARQVVLWTWRGTLRRALRCVTAAPRSHDEVPAMLAACIDTVYRCDVDQPVDLDRVPETRAAWSCDAGLPPPAAHVCLLCDSTDLEIEGGAYDVAELRCRACGADLEFRHETSPG